MEPLFRKSLRPVSPLVRVLHGVCVVQYRCVATLCFCVRIIYSTWELKNNPDKPPPLIYTITNNKKNYDNHLSMCFKYNSMEDPLISLVVWWKVTPAQGNLHLLSVSVPLSFLYADMGLT